MKKLLTIGLFSLIGLLFSACGEEYVMPTDASFAGTWVLDSVIGSTPVTPPVVVPPADSTADSVTTRFSVNTKATDNPVRQFIEIRSGMILFYTNGRYDSSYFYIDKANELSVRRIQDTVTAIISYQKTDDKGAIVLDSITQKPIILFDTVRQPGKPTSPNTPSDADKYFATYKFEGDKLILTKKNKPAFKAIYSRPKETN